MKFFVLFFVFILSSVAVKAQSETDSSVTSVPEDEITKIQERGMAILEIRILTSNLPEDLLAKALDLVLIAQIQTDSCHNAYTVNHIVWQYKVCIITQLKIANIAITQLEIEAAGRPTATTSATNL